MLKAMKKFLNGLMLTPEEKYLASASDLADLERRQRELNLRLSNKLGYWI